MLATALLVAGSPALAQDSAVASSVGGGGKEGGKAEKAGPKISKAGAEPSAKDQKAAELAAKVQKFYESTLDFSADFEQNYRYKAMRRTQKSSGVVLVKKPGLMRWDYKLPYPKHFVLDGKALYVFDPEDNAVLVSREFSSDGLSAAVTFLWGRGSLSEEFEISLVEQKSYGDTVLELVPRTPQPGFSRLFFAINPKSGAVLTSVVIDSQGNENRITFKEVKTNTGLNPKHFSFEIPEGATVQELN